MQIQLVSCVLEKMEKVCVSADAVAKSYTKRCVGER